MAAEDLTFRAFGEDVSAGRMFKKIDDDADKARRSIKELDRQMEEAAANRKALIQKYAETGDKSLFKDIRKDDSTIAQLERMKRALEPTDESVSRWSLIGKVLQGLPSASPLLIGGAVAAAVAILPELGAMIGGAVLGGVGLGGVVGGIALAARDSRVQDAAKALGTELMSGLSEAARPALAPTLDALTGELRDAAQSLSASLAGGFADVAPTIKPLAEGIRGLIENLEPGLSDAFKAAEPAIRAIANELPEFGRSISDALSSISDGSDGAVEGLITLLHYFEELITFTGDLIGVLSDTYDWFLRTGNEISGWGEKWLGWIPIFGSVAKATHDETQSVLDGMGKATDASHDFTGALLGNAKSAQQAADETKKFNDAIEGLFGVLMSVDEANIRYKQGIADLTKELKDGKKTLDINTQDGRDNRKAILDQVKAIEDLREANVNNHMPVEKANALYEQQLDDLVKLAENLGFNKQQIEQLVGAYKKIPAQVTTPVHTPGLSASADQAYNLHHELDAIDGRVTTTYVRTVFGDYRADERKPAGRASGGPTQANRMYMVGENGPELWMESSNGHIYDAETTKRLMSGASGGSSIAASAEPTRIVFELVGGDEELRRWFKKSVRVYGGGDVQVAFGGN